MSGESDPAITVIDDTLAGGPKATSDSAPEPDPGAPSLSPTLDRATAPLEPPRNELSNQIDAGIVDSSERPFQLADEAENASSARLEPHVPASTVPDGVGVRASDVPDQGTALRLVRWGLRFESDETEAAYGTHHRRVAVPLTRLGMATSLVVWAAFTAVTWFAAPESFTRVAACVLLLMMPLIACCLAVTYRQRWSKWMLPLVALTNASAGVLVVILSVWVAHRLDVAMGGTVIATYFGFTIFRMRTDQAAASTAAYIILFHLVLFEELVAGRVGVPIALPYSVTVITAFVTGLLVCALLDRSMRQAYQQERTIEAQRLAIERERARAVHLQAQATERELALLNAEVRRQVAERARDLAQALSRLSDAPRAQSVLAPGNVVEGRYRVVRLLGRGGMGQVHEVERLVDGRRLALKMMTGAPHREALIRLAREAEIAAQLDHPNVVAALDVGITVSGAVFLVMQLVAGPTLEQQALRFGDVPWAVPILAQIARALAVMHAHGIIHRDLKPSNVLLEGTTVKVTDFGIASLARPVGSEPLTRTGVIIGTPLYMAPELADGTREATPASDVFSLGVVAHEILANRLPHALPPALERLHGRAPERALTLGQTNSTLPVEVIHLVDRCLKYASEERPSAQVAADLFGRLSAPGGL
jgi:hypothetical protein